MVRAYCGKCRRRVDVKDIKDTEIQGKKRKIGKCPYCGSTIIIKE